MHQHLLVHPFRVGPWQVQPQQNRIDGPKGEVRVEPKVMAVLCFLAAQPGEVATREALFETVWAGTVVTDDVLTRSISELRKAFSDTPRQPTIIETIPKTGYRLIAPVTHLAPGDSSPHLAPVLELSVPSLPPAPPPRRAPGWLAAAALTALALALLWGWSRGSARPEAWQTTPLTTEPGLEANPAFSPDGQQIAFAWNGPAQDNWDIYIRLAEAPHPTRLTDDPAGENSPAFSPDGQWVAFVRYTQAGCQLFRVTVLGGPAERLGACTGNIYPDLAWSPDGKTLAFSGRTDRRAPFQIFLHDLETGTQRPVTRPPAPHWGDHDPSFREDGQTLAFTRSASEGIQDLYRLELATEAETRLTFDARNLVGHDWLPGDDALVFASNRGGTYGLWRLPATGGTPTLLLTTGWKVAKPVMDPAGTTLLFEQWQADTDIWRMNNPRLDPTAAPVPWINSTRWDLHPSIAPDGSQIAFTSNRTGFYEVWLADSLGQNATQRTRFEGPFTGTARWSPDGRHLVFDSRPEGHADLYLMDASGGTPQRLTTDPADDLAASWSADGQWIYFASSRGGQWRVWKMQPGEAPIAVTATRGFAAFEAPDGHTLYFTRTDTTGVWQMPTGGGPPTQVFDNLPREDWGHWAVRPEGLYFLQRTPTYGLAFHDFGTDSTALLHALDRPVPRLDPAFAVAPDSRWFLWGHIGTTTGDLIRAVPAPK